MATVTPSKPVSSLKRIEIVPQNLDSEALSPKFDADADSRPRGNQPKPKPKTDASNPIDANDAAVLKFRPPKKFLKPRKSKIPAVKKTEENTPIETVKVFLLSL